MPAWRSTPYRSITSSRPCTARVRQGLTVAPLLMRAGIPPALLDAPLARVSQAQYGALLRVLRRRLRDEFWGLLSEPLPLGCFAQCCRLLVQTPTLGDALRTGLRYFHGEIDEFVPRLRVSRRHGEHRHRAARGRRRREGVRAARVPLPHLRRGVVAGGAAHTAGGCRVPRAAAAARRRDRPRSSRPRSPTGASTTACGSTRAGCCCRRCRTRRACASSSSRRRPTCS